MSKVTLIGVTQPVNLADLNTAEQLVAYAARVSNPNNQSNTETAPKLLKYLINNKHWSPLEMVHLVMEIETTRDIARQILRHRSFSFQEFSQRYARADDLGFTNREARLQDLKNRQNSIDLDTDNDMQRQIAYQWEILQENLLNKVTETYQWALDKGIAKEQARTVLPEGLTKSRMYMSGSLRSWIHYCQLRTDPSTQKEHREVAKLALDIIKEQFPSIAEIVGE